MVLFSANNICFWSRNKTNGFQLHTIIKMPVDGLFTINIHETPLFHVSVFINKHYVISFQLMQNHIVEGSIISKAIPPDSVMQIDTLNSDSLLLVQKHLNNSLTVNKHSSVLDSDMLATNGIFFKINRVLHVKHKKKES